jgi:uncharacterized DUF497 family protein
VNIVWDTEKSLKLKRQRGISLEEVAELIVEQEYVEIVEHSKRPNQRIFLVPIRGYIHAVPFVLDEKDNIDSSEDSIPE